VDNDTQITRETIFVGLTTETIRIRRAPCSIIARHHVLAS
jgi:hypothetical protein